MCDCNNGFWSAFGSPGGGGSANTLQEVLDAGSTATITGVLSITSDDGVDTSIISNDAGAGISFKHEDKLQVDHYQAITIIDDQIHLDLIDVNGSVNNSYLHMTHSSSVELKYEGDNGAGGDLGDSLLNLQRNQGVFSLNNASGTSSLTLTPTLATIEGTTIINDDANSKGAAYNDDYSTAGIATYGNRWIIDKGYADANYAPTGTYALVGTYTDSYVPRWNATTNTLANSPLRSDGTTISLGAAVSATDTVRISHAFASASQVYGVSSATSNTGVGDVSSIYSVSAGGNDVSATVATFRSGGVTAGTQSLAIHLYMEAHGAGTSKYGIYQAGANDKNYFAGAVTLGAFTLPNTDGMANQVLTTDGAGTVTWEDGGGGASFGTTTQIPYMNAGGTDFIYSSNFTYNGNELSVKNGGLVKVYNVAQTNYSQVSDGYLTCIRNGKTFQIDGSGALGYPNIYSSTHFAIQGGGSNVTYTKFDDAGNVGIAAGATLSARLHVKSTGTTSATLGLLVQDSGGTDMFYVRDDATVTLGSASSDQNVLAFRETTQTISNTANYGKVYVKDDENLYFQDGSGNEGEVLNTISASKVITKKLNTTATATIYTDANILLEFQDAATDDIALEILTNPSSEDVHILVSDVGGSLTAYDRVIADGKLDIDTDFGNDDRLDITIFAPSDATYQAYRITLVKSNPTTYTNTPMMAIIELLPTFS